METLSGDQIMQAFFGRRNGGVPKQLREHLGFAADAINAHQRGLSVPDVALNYRYEPIQGMMMIRTCCDDCGFNAVARHVPAHIMSLVQAQFPDARSLQPLRSRAQRPSPR